MVIGIPGKDVVVRQGPGAAGTEGIKAPRYLPQVQGSRLQHLRRIPAGNAPFVDADDNLCHQAFQRDGNDCVRPFGQLLGAQGAADRHGHGGHLRVGRYLIAEIGHIEPFFRSWNIA